MSGRDSILFSCYASLLTEWVGRVRVRRKVAYDSVQMAAHEELIRRERREKNMPMDTIFADGRLQQSEHQRNNNNFIIFNSLLMHIAAN